MHLAAGLSLLSIDIMPPTEAWGSMVSEARDYLLGREF